LPHLQVALQETLLDKKFDHCTRVIYLVAKIHHLGIKKKVASNMVKEFFGKFSKRIPAF
jgi:hypothetical protein